ncbi:MAG TPA: addiction module protein [Gammaproteobacteria bacterium]|nr:addiction module protein [Gammaproteobacteria bacterium]
MATKADELMSMVESLPIEIKTKLIEKILNSLHPTQKEIDELWAKEVEKRLNDIRTGKVKPVPADEVFEEIQKIYNK